MEWGGIKTLEIILYNKCFICLYMVLKQCLKVLKITRPWRHVSDKCHTGFSKIACILRNMIISASFPIIIK
jgi:hypothetical protein